MKKVLVYLVGFVLVVLVVGIYRSFNKEQEPVYSEINHRVKTMRISNDSLFIRFKSNYFKRIIISLEITSIKKERYVFTDWVSVKNNTSVIPLTQFAGYDGEKYIPRQIQVIKFETSRPDSVLVESHEPYLDGFDKTPYHSYELWYRDKLNNYYMARSFGGVFFVKKTSVKQKHPNQ